MGSRITCASTSLRISVMARCAATPRIWELPNDVAAILREIPLLTISQGYWERAGRLRSKIIARKRRARLADSLIAQTCLDHDLALITRDGDFHSFAAFASLKLVTDLA